MAWSDIAFDPLLPLWLTLLLGAGVLLPGLVSLAQGLRGGATRLLLGLGLALLLAGPQLVRETREALDRHVLVATDASESMRIGDRTDQVARARQQIETFLADQPDLEPHFVTVPQAEDGTRLFGPLARALQELPADRLAGVIALTDGQIHDGTDAAGFAGIDAPVHALLAGDRSLKDRRIEMVTAPRYALVDKTTRLKVRVAEDNLDTQGPVTITVQVDGRRRFSVPGRVGEAVSLPIRPERRGSVLVEVSVDRAEGERFLGNNRTVLRLNAVRDRLKVLLISGEPHVGERVWRTALKSDPSVDLVHFTILRLPDSRDLTPESELSLIPFPTKRLFEEKLSDFDLIIFDRYTRRSVLERRHLMNLVEFVETGGAILVSTGPEFAQSASLFRTPLQPILPAAPTGTMLAQPYRPAVTDVGAKHPVTAPLTDQGPWGRWFRVLEAAVLGGDVLMEGAEGRPLLVLSRVGEGRIAQILSDQIWLWARGVESGGPDQQLLRRTAHWLMKEPDLEEEALEASAKNAGEIAISRRSLGEAAGPVSVTGPVRAAEGQIDTMVRLSETAPGRAAGVAQVPRRGLYRVSDQRHETLVAVGMESGREYEQLLPTDTAIGALVAATGGGRYWLEDGVPDIRRVGARDRRAGSGWMGLVRDRANRVVSVEQRPLLPPWAWVALLLGLLVAAWVRESR